MHLDYIEIWYEYFYWFQSLSCGNKQKRLHMYYTKCLGIKKNDLHLILKWFRRRYNVYVRICLGREKEWRKLNRMLKFGELEWRVMELLWQHFYILLIQLLMRFVAWDVWPMATVGQLICVVFKAKDVSEKIEMAERVNVRDTIKRKSPYPVG